MRGLFHASRTLGVQLVVVAIIGYSGIGWGALYQCRDALGAEVLTDSPTSSEQCKSVKGVSSLGAPPQEPRTPPGEPPCDEVASHATSDGPARHSRSHR